MGRGDPALTAHVARVLAELHVETPIHLQHQHLPVAEVPLAASEPKPPVGVAAPTLTAGSADPELGAGTIDVYLGKRLRPATDVREQATELLCAPERPESFNPVAGLSASVSRCCTTAATAPWAVRLLGS